MSVDSTSDYSYFYMTIHIQNIFTLFTYCIIPTDYIPTEGILYLGGVKVRKFQLVSKKNSIGI